VAALLRGQHDEIVKWRGEWLRSRYDTQPPDVLQAAARSLAAIPGP
jgi:hypothetical protein